jgi:aspartate aminotransferase
MFNAALEMRARGLTVYDLSLGNPELEPPQLWKDVVRSLVGGEERGRHRYMNNCGFPEVRTFVAERESAIYGVEFAPSDVTMTVGAAGGLNVAFRAVLDPGDEILTPAPFFTEYRNYTDNHDVKLVAVPTRADFTLDVDGILSRITEKTKIVLLNSPNNPTGAVYDVASLEALAAGLRERSLPRPLYVIEDAPYRNLMYDGSTAPSMLGRYANTMLVTSHSKDLALPGERIGYLMVSPECTERNELNRAFEYWNRVLGFVNAPALMQRTLVAVLGKPGGSVDPQIYARKCELMSQALTTLGFALPEIRAGFFLFPKLPTTLSLTPTPGSSRDVAFCQMLAAQGCLAVPGIAFGGEDHIRLALCVDDETLNGAVQVFRKVCDGLRHRP